MSKIIIFDVETTGFTKYMDKNGVDLKNHNRMTQLAFLVADTKKWEVIDEYSSLIRPDSWFVPAEQFFIDNGMSTDKCMKFGLPASFVLEQFVEALKTTDIKIAHNLVFDNRIVQNELRIYGFATELFKYKKSICTMKSSVDFCKIPGRYKGSYKWPKLMELHNILFGAKFDGAHDALYDVRATYKCLKKLVELKQIEL